MYLSLRTALAPLVACLHFYMADQWEQCDHIAMSNCTCDASNNERKSLLLAVNRTAGISCILFWKWLTLQMGQTVSCELCETMVQPKTRRMCPKKLILGAEQQAMKLKLLNATWLGNGMQYENLWSWQCLPQGPRKFVEHCISRIVSVQLVTQ